MNWFGLLMAHLVGDYIVQNDWMATWKAAPAGKLTEDEEKEIAAHHGDQRMHILSVLESMSYWRPMAACVAHCTAYTLAVWAFTWWWMPWWGLAACWLLHYPLDRFGLAKLWMVHVSGQEKFATGMLSPWSIVVVDNTFHLLALYGIAALAGAP